MILPKKQAVHKLSLMIYVDAGEAECELSGYSYNCGSCEAVTVDLGTDALLSDGDGDYMDVRWSNVSWQYVGFSDTETLQTTATIDFATANEPGECNDTAVELLLTVTDCFGDSTTDSVIITATCCGAED